MALLTLLPVLILTSASLIHAQECTIKKSPDPPAGQCKVRGTLGRPEPARQFYAESYEGCMFRAQFDYIGRVASYDTSSGACLFYFEELKQMKYTNDSSSTLLFANQQCYQRSTGCTLLNPSFEHPDIAGGDIVPKPKGYKNGESIELLPWDYAANHKTYFKRTANKNLPKGAQPTPDGDNFALAHVSGTDQPSLLQRVRLKRDTDYALSLYYSYIDFQGNRSESATNYAFRVFLQAIERGQGTPILEVGLDQKNGDDDGVWRSVSGTFTTRNFTDIKPRFGSVLMLLQIASPGAETPAKSSTFGFDGFNLTEVTV